MFIPFINYQIQPSKYVIPIQAGAALTDTRIAELTDDNGDNISVRNRRYSEMTVFYWMWKNIDADYLGICHYRRVWKDVDDIVAKLQADEIDAILPVPTFCVHSVTEDYLKKHIPDVYPTMLDVLRELSYEYYAKSEEIYGGQIFYGCNMCILKKHIFHELCEWLFPILKRTEEFNIVYYMLKPFELQLLEKRILSTTTNTLSDGQILHYESIELQKQTTKIIHELGVPSNLKGYNYLREGIILVYNDPNLAHKITTSLYPKIADKYASTVSRVERSMRHAIEVSWNRGNWDMMEEIFGYSVSIDKSKPTNSEFIVTIADSLRLQNNKSNI